MIRNEEEITTYLLNTIEVGATVEIYASISYLPVMLYWTVGRLQSRRYIRCNRDQMGL